METEQLAATVSTASEIAPSSETERLTVTTSPMKRRRRKVAAIAPFLMDGEYFNGKKELAKHIGITTRTLDRWFSEAKDRSAP